MSEVFDYVLIPDGGKVLRAARMKAAERFLRHHEAKEVLVMNGADSEEDVLILGKILFHHRKAKRLAIVTFPLHFEEYEVLIKKAVRDRSFPSGVLLYNVRTHQGFRLTLYGLLGLLEEKVKRRKLLFKPYRHELLLDKVKQLAHKIV